MVNVLMMKNKNNIIYKVVNIKNQKVYIGATTKSMEDRKQDHVAKAANGEVNKLYEDIRAYGSDFFI